MRKFLLSFFFLVMATACTELRAEVTRFIGADGEPHEISHDASLDEFRAETSHLRGIVYDRLGMGSREGEDIEANIIKGVSRLIHGIEFKQTGGKRLGADGELHEFVGLRTTTPQQEAIWYLEKDRDLAEHRKKWTTQPGERDYQDRVIGTLNARIKVEEERLKRLREYSVYSPDLLGGSLRISTIDAELNRIEQQIDAAVKRKNEASGKQNGMYGEALEEETRLVDRKWVLIDLKTRMKELPGAVARAHEQTRKRLPELKPDTEHSRAEVARNEGGAGKICNKGIGGLP